jgi:hypothetical protein
VRLDRLIRLILADPRCVNVDELPRIARRAGRRIFPLAHPDMVNEAAALLGPWLSGPLAHDLSAARAVERHVPWTITWPQLEQGSSASDTPAIEGGAHVTVFQGTADLAIQNDQGAWRVVNFHLAESPANREDLRVLLSAHALEAHGRSPVHRAERAELGPEGTLVKKSLSQGNELAALVKSLSM